MGEQRFDSFELLTDRLECLELFAGVGFSFFAGDYAEFFGVLAEGGSERGDGFRFPSLSVLNATDGALGHVREASQVFLLEVLSFACGS